mmetsp:Transcript_6639/g.20099  ORF Transcript_6639/g.20099 Transcript_6639/m.20099 type:complete len:283 (-) Transcript_6639:81-929(-)
MSQRSQERYEMCIDAENLLNMDRTSLSDPFVVVSVKEPRDGQYVEWGRTETVWEDLNPRFVVKFCDIERIPPESRLLLTFYDRDAESEKLTKHDLLGQCRFIVRQAMESRTTPLVLNLVNSRNSKDAGRCIVYVDRVVVPAQAVMATFEIRFGSVERTLSGMNRCYLQVCRRSDSDRWTPIYRSENVRVDSGCTFDLFSIEDCMVNAGNPARNSLLEIHKIYSVSQKTKLVASAEFNFAEMIRVRKGYTVNFWRQNRPTAACLTVVDYLAHSDDLSIRLEHF